MADTGNHRALIIAEAGVNHDGNIAQAIQLIDVAADAGADLVKFQTFDAKALAAPPLKAAYQEQASECETNLHRAIGDVAALTAQRGGSPDVDCALRGSRHWFFLNGVRFREPRLPRSPCAERFKVPSGRSRIFPTSGVSLRFRKT